MFKKDKEHLHSKELQKIKFNSIIRKRRGDINKTQYVLKVSPYLFIFFEYTDKIR